MSEDYTFWVEETEPALDEELNRIRGQWFERTGRPGFRIRDSLFNDIDAAVARARALHSEGIPVRVYVRFARKEPGS